MEAKIRKLRPRSRREAKRKKYNDSGHNEVKDGKIGRQGSGTNAKKREAAVIAAERRTRFGAVLGIRIRNRIRIRRSACF
jgi:hypothetical protein